MTMVALEHNTPFALGCIATTILIISLYNAHFFTPYPLKNLGKRPLGYGIWTYIVEQYLSPSHQGTMYGYDSSLGSFNSVWRVSFHLCAVLYLWSMLLYIVDFIPLITEFELIPNATIEEDFQIGILALLFYTISFLVYEKFSKGVSHPGGPREHKIRRMPQWEDKVTSLDDVVPEHLSWRCAVATDSHRVTLKRFGLEAKDGENGIKDSDLGLSGEPFGRQMWATGDKIDMIQDKRQVDLIKSIASAGRQGFNPSQNPNSGDILFREQMIKNYVSKGGILPDVTRPCVSVKDAVRKAVHFYSMLQTEDGHWAGDYGGPHFLMPGLIIAWYIMGKPEKMLDKEQCRLMAHYLLVHQQTDGGWGTHIESPSTMFGTVMCYVSLRLLGIDSNLESMKKGRNFIQRQGGAIMTSSWAKFWLCLLGCMDWRGHNSVPPEMWLLPNWIPFHPGRLWCHCRMVYLPMGYLYGAGFVYDGADTDPVILELRNELYCGNYDRIQWSKTRHFVANMDNYSPLPYFMKLVQNGLARYESWLIFQPLKNLVRKKGLKFCREYMIAEDLQTNYIDIGPVNKVLNMLSAYHGAGNDINNVSVQNHMMRVADYLWVAEDGMKMQGYNGSQCWDTSFAIQAISECDLLDEFPLLSKQVWSYLERTQILSTEVSQSSPAYKYEENVYREKFYRHVSQGGWPFSTSAHGWPISDCTGEGLKGVLVLMNSPTIINAIQDKSLKEINDDRICDAVNVILTLQNEDGGWATYENNRGFGWYEQLNPSEVFGDIMIDYSYVECSMASLTGLVAFQKRYPSFRKREVDFAIKRGRDFIKSIQREDGSWYGSWACCFCYGCWFGIEGLVRAGESPSSKIIQRCCDFLLKRQRANGGWGEDFTSCYDKDYAVNGMDSYGDEGSGVVNTGWALLALSEAKCQDVDAIRRGVKYLIKRQLPSGDWPQEGISGVFNRACGITYTAYRNIFPIWALGRCIETYGASVLDE